MEAPQQALDQKKGVQQENRLWSLIGWVTASGTLDVVDTLSIYINKAIATAQWEGVLALEV